ncbi:MAG: efflux RND transporter permease subunit [Chloroflexi bacterium]|nr:efflux RND transporter permease subunit [Chloroflexota bacterium]
MILLTRLALRARIATLILAVIIMAGGVFALTRLQIELLPDIDFPLVTITAPHPGADAETVLNEVTIPLEEALGRLNLLGLVKVRSVSVPGFSVILTEFDFGADMKAAAETATRELNRLALPAGAGPVLVQRANPNEFPILQLSVLGPMGPAELHELVAAEVLPAIRAIPEVLTVETLGALNGGGGITRTNGQPSVSIVIVKDPDANTVEVVDAVLQRVEAAKANLPAGVEFITIANQAPDIEASIGTLTREVMLGAALAVLVIFVFLLSVRPTVVTSVSIPLSLLAGLIVMQAQGMSLNIVTLGALAIAAGRVVDDSIVVMENIYRHIQMGEDRMVAALAATREVAMPILVSTLTTIAVFAPLGFIGGLIGTFFRPLALTITYALLASLVVALTVVPALGSILITRRVTPSQDDEREPWLQRAYTPFLKWALSHRVLTLMGAGVMFFASLGLLPFIPFSFLPGFGQNVLEISVHVPAGSSQATTLEQLDEIETTLAQLRLEGSVEVYHSQAGIGNIFAAGGGPPGASPSAATILVRLRDDVDANAMAEALRRDLDGPNRSLMISEAQGGGPSSDRLELTLLGDDYVAVASTAERLRSELALTEGLINVRHDAAIAPDGSVFSGDVPIVRVNGRRAVTISGSIVEANTRIANQRVDETVARVGLPAGVDLDTGGVFADVANSFRQMGMAMLIGLTLVYLVMVVSQRSLIAPLIIVFSVPLASIGALGALFITQRTLGLPALMGMLMLIGLVVTNAIVLIAFVEQLRERGRGVRDALLEGGRTRLRPILMTAFTTSFVLVPLALDGGASSGIVSSELATVIIGGLMTSTFLTLVVVPVVYSIIRREKKAKDGADRPRPSGPDAPISAGAPDIIASRG